MTRVLMFTFTALLFSVSVSGCAGVEMKPLDAGAFAGSRGGGDGGRRATLEESREKSGEMNPGETNEGDADDGLDDAGNDTGINSISG